ncbi:hypothetical protein AV530_006484 [Patagioenas fasciata monilis]|uniref:Uncharacterized protein n=1 Tax=Patagioenas fasciata monilis TaxID=372326 RepID=A0A1V4KGL0_PATFA|nr:hypothetical protein AV530_006484 [Patagioenas fasciata monilis]
MSKTQSSGWKEIRLRADKYSNVAEASDKLDGLAIITVFLKLGLCNENPKDVLKALDSVKTKVNIVTVSS